MQVRINIQDAVTPDLSARIAAQPEKIRDALEAIGLLLVSLAKRAFSNSALRPSSWPTLKAATLEQRRKQGFRGTAPLRASGALWQSLRVLDHDARSVTVGSDRRVGAWSLAAIHQLGAPRRGVPARPFFPVEPTGALTPDAQRQADTIAARKLAP